MEDGQARSDGGREEGREEGRKEEYELFPLSFLPSVRRDFPIRILLLLLLRPSTNKPLTF